MKDKEDRLRHKVDEELDARVRAARQEIDHVVDDLRKQVEKLNAEASRRAQQGHMLHTSEAGAARSDARAALDTLADRMRAGADAHIGKPAVSARPASVGDRVTMKGLGLEGRVVLIHDGDAEVDVRGKRLRARLSELVVVAGGPQAQQPARISVNVHVAAREGSQTEINVIGCSVDEAIGRVEHFLDDMLLNDERSVRIIHGHGTGQLRRAIGELLQRHPLVAHHQPELPEKGGGGVTVAELKD